MKSQPSVLTATAVASAASRKARKVQAKLTQAEADLKASIKVLAKPKVKHETREVQDALKHNLAAEAKVKEATEELDVVAELLTEVKDALPDATAGLQQGRSGEGAKSAIPHLRNSAG